MPVVNEQTFQVAGVVEPLSTTSSNTLLFDADKTLYFALDFWSWVIGFFAGPRLLNDIVAPGMPTQITSAVAQRYPNDPAPYLTSDQAKFPLLAMYRKDTKYEWRRVGWVDDHVTFDLLYILPPLNMGQAERVVPILTAIEKAIRYKTVQSFDPSYTPPGGTAGQTPWGLQFACVEQIGFDKGHRVTWQEAGNLVFPTLHMEGFFRERDMYVGAEQKFAGGDITVNLEAPDTTVISPLMQISTQQAPTVASLSVTSGPIAGGTSVTITGTLFLAGPLGVYFGIYPAANVVWNSATSITCSAPAVANPGAIGVTVLNRDGQAGSLANAFTFTP